MGDKFTKNVLPVGISPFNLIDPESFRYLRLNQKFFLTTVDPEISVNIISRRFNVVHCMFLSIGGLLVNSGTSRVGRWPENLGVVVSTAK